MDQAQLIGIGIGIGALAFMLIVIFLPGGLMEGINRVGGWLRRLGRRSAPQPDPSPAE